MRGAEVEMNLLASWCASPVWSAVISDGGFWARIPMSESCSVSAFYQ